MIEFRDALTELLDEYGTDDQGEEGKRSFLWHRYLPTHISSTSNLTNFLQFILLPWMILTNVDMSNLSFELLCFVSW